MAIRRVDKSNRTTFMQKFEVNGIALENDPLILSKKPLADYATNFVIHTVTDFDRIDLISYRYYNTSSYWWMILLANSMMDEREVVQGFELKIISLRDYQDYLDDFDV